MGDWRVACGTGCGILIMLHRNDLGYPTPALPEIKEGANVSSLEEATGLGEGESLR